MSADPFFASSKSIPALSKRALNFGDHGPPRAVDMKFLFVAMWWSGPVFGALRYHKASITNLLESVFTSVRVIRSVEFPNECFLVRQNLDVMLEPN